MTLPIETLELIDSLLMQALPEVEIARRAQCSGASVNRRKQVLRAKGIAVPELRRGRKVMTTSRRVRRSRSAEAAARSRQIRERHEGLRRKLKAEIERQTRGISAEARDRIAQGRGNQRPWLGTHRW